MAFLSVRNVQLLAVNGKNFHFQETGRKFDQIMLHLQKSTNQCQ